MNPRPKILITNDDSISAPGIKHLWRALKDFCDLTIVAPATEKSGVGLGLTLWDPVHILEAPWEENTAAWKITGTPADCVRLAMSKILQNPPDLIVSGINRGSNAGRTVLYSGTIGGVIEGVMHNIPGIAFSCKDYENPSYERFEKHVYPIVRYLLDHPLPSGCLLNVNFPATKEIKGLKLTSQGISHYKQAPIFRTHPEGFEYAWMSGEWLSLPECETSDVTALEQGFISAAPIFVLDLTHRDVLENRKDHFEKLLNS